MATRIGDELIAQAQRHRGWHEVASVFPLMDADQFATFCQDIKRGRQRESIKTFDGLVVDGRNRQMACLAVGIEPFYEEVPVDIPDRDALANYVWSLNLERRHLNPSQKGLAAAEMRKWLGGNTTKAAAAATGASERMVRRAARVKEKGVPELVTAVQSGKIRLDDAEQIIGLPPEQQRERVAAVEKGATRKVTQVPRAAPAANDNDEEWLANAAAPYVDGVKAINKIISDFQSLADDPQLGIHLPWSRLRIDLESAKNAIYHNQPVAFCCGNAAADKKCTCAGAGFVTRFQWDDPAVRSAVQAKAKKPEKKPKPAK